MGKSINPMWCSFQTQGEAVSSSALRPIVLMSLQPAIPWRVALLQCPPPLHRLDSMYHPPAVTVNHHFARAEEFSTGTLGNFQPELTQLDSRCHAGCGVVGNSQDPCREVAASRARRRTLFTRLASYQLASIKVCVRRAKYAFGEPKPQGGCAQQSQPPPLGCCQPRMPVRCTRKTLARGDSRLPLCRPDEKRRMASRRWRE